MKKGNAGLDCPVCKKPNWTDGGLRAHLYHAARTELLERFLSKHTPPISEDVPHAWYVQQHSTISQKRTISIHLE